MKGQCMDRPARRYCVYGVYLLIGLLAGAFLIRNINLFCIVLMFVLGMIIGALFWAIYE